MNVINRLSWLLLAPFIAAFGIEIVIHGCLIAAHIGALLS